MNTNTKIVIGMLVAASITYIVLAYIDGTKKPTVADKTPKQLPGEELRQGLANNTPVGPTDAADFMAAYMAKNLTDDTMKLLSGPMYTGNDLAYGTINGGMQVNRSKYATDSDKEGVISYDSPMGRFLKG